MARTTDSAVQAILGDHYDSRMSLSPFIATATALVDKVEAADTDGELAAADLELIERWLAGHFYQAADPQYTSRSTGGASGSLVAISYWDMAARLDVTGYLAGLAAPVRAKAGAAWLGRPPSEQTDYVDRD